MAARTAEHLRSEGIELTRLIASPLQRAQESAVPISSLYNLGIDTEPRVIEPSNRFEGKSFEAGKSALAHPGSWPWMINPFRPSWGEAYASIAQRMIAAMTDAWHTTESGDIAIVSHQLPIWMVHRRVSGEKLPHDPRKRRCALSSVTSFRYDPEPGRFTEIGYADPNDSITAIDQGAV